MRSLSEQWEKRGVEKLRVVCSSINVNKIENNKVKEEEEFIVLFGWLKKLQREYELRMLLLLPS